MNGQFLPRKNPAKTVKGRGFLDRGLMKHEIEVQFEVGDVVWHKNLATNEAIQTKIKSYQAIINSDGSSCVIYHTEDQCPIVNIIGKPSNTNVFATKEECDSWHAYVPDNN